MWLHTVVKLPLNVWYFVCFMLSVTTDEDYKISSAAICCQLPKRRFCTRLTEMLQILYEVQGTGAGRCSENTWKLVIQVWPTDLAHLSTRSEVPAMAVTHSSCRQLWYFKTLSIRLLQFVPKITILSHNSVKPEQTDKMGILLDSVWLTLFGRYHYFWCPLQTFINPLEFIEETSVLYNSKTCLRNTTFLMFLRCLQY